MTLLHWLLLPVLYLLVIGGLYALVYVGGCVAGVFDIAINEAERWWKTWRA
jgi:hypothetical protein